MKRLLSSVCLVLLSLTVMVPDADARRFGGGGTSGMKRTTPPPAPAAPPAKQATPAPTNAAAPTAGAAAAAAPKRSWMGPIAGIAAGLGIAALMSHLGMGAAMGNILTMLLMAAAAFFVIRFLMRRFGPRPAQNGLQFAGAGNAPGHGLQAGQPAASPAGWQSGAAGSGAGVATPVSAVAPGTAAATSLPADFDAAGFERAAKLIFIRMQAANDVGDLNDLRAFTTPEMFASVKLDLQDRKGAPQQTDVVQLDAQVVDHAEENGQYVVSVRFHGLIREEKDAAASAFDEVWHLVKPVDGSREWAIAGIAQSA
jgi:predicted lipid-binding transport protein (Tim44 family)